ARSLSMKRLGMAYLPSVATALAVSDPSPVCPSEPGPTIRPTHDRGGDGGGETRGRRAPADRGGRCVVRVPRGDSEPIGEPLPRGRAMGLGAPVAAPARNQGAAGPTPPGCCVGASANRIPAASPAARGPPQAIAALTAQPAPR